MIDYTKRLTIERERYPIKDIDNSIESDRGRIISSPAFRRLQKRTQVFPLELNAAVRSRLTHSLEVQQTSRYIAKSILALIAEQGDTELLGLSGMDNAFVSTAEMAALLHDIGNPPFGHFAEMAINKWIDKEAPAIAAKLFPELNDKKMDFQAMLLRDLSSFDGNAQGIRIIVRLQRLNLSYTQVAAVLKYTRGAYEPRPDKRDRFAYLKKKPGFYYSEKAFVSVMYQSLGMQKGARFPITYIMEAADDISYLTADIEDAVDKDILSLEEIYRLLKIEIQQVYPDEVLGEVYLMELVEKAYGHAKKDEKPYQFNMFLTLFRAWLINDLVKYVSKIYLENHEAIFNGTFDHALLEYDSTSDYAKAVKALQQLSIKHIYNDPEVETLELKGHAILTGLLDKYRPVLELNSDEMKRLIEDRRIADVLAMTLFRRLPKKHIVAYSNSVEQIDEAMDEDESDLLEWYYRVRLLLDYISGMTDDFALREYQTLTAITV